MRSYPGSGGGHQDRAAPRRATARTPHVGPVAVGAAGLATLWAWTLAPDVAAASLGAALAALPLLALLTEPGRAAITALSGTYRISLIAFCAALLALFAPAIGAGAADGRAAMALRDIATIAGIGLGAFGVAALAAAGRWRPVNAALLAAGALTAAASAIVSALAGAAHSLALFPDRAAGVAFFGLIAAQALVTLGDEIGRRSPMSGRHKLAPLSRRTLIPVLAGLAALLMIIGGGSRTGAVVAVAALALAAAAWTVREKRTGVLAFRIGAVILAALVAGLAFTGATPAAGSTLDSWLARVGLIGAGALAVAFVVFLAQIAMAEDRGRRPARGFALALAAGALVLLAAALSSTAATAPLVAFAALQIGLSAGVVDVDLRPQRAGQLVTATT